MYVKILQSIEDSNTFDDINDPLTAVQPFTIGHRFKTITENISFIVRVDRLAPHHGLIELPKKQAQKLIDLGYARVPTEKDFVEQAAKEAICIAAAEEVLERYGKRKK